LEITSSPIGPILRTIMGLPNGSRTWIGRHWRFGMLCAVSKGHRFSRRHCRSFWTASKQKDRVKLFRWCVQNTAEYVYLYRSKQGTNPWNTEDWGLVDVGACKWNDGHCFTYKYLKAIPSPMLGPEIRVQVRL
jgi:hypothetical protein